MLSFPRCAKASVTVALAAVMVAATASPAMADRTRNQEWWLNKLRVTTAWATSKGSGVTVALLDTGAYAATPDLRGTIITGPDFTKSGRHRRGPFWGIHGTAMASLIAGHGHGPDGRKGVSGIAPQAKILSIRVVLEGDDPLQASQATASRQLAAIADGIRYAVGHGAQIIDLPLDPGAPAPHGGPSKAATGGSKAERAAVAYALSKGIVLVAPAGDDGNGANRKNYPAAYPGVISVGAFNKGIVKAKFSSRHSYVTLTAPGDGVIAAQPSGKYATFHSTAAASAIVAGVAALIKSRYSFLSPAQVTTALTQGTDFRRRGGRATGSGFGAVDAVRALSFAATMRELSPTASAAPPTPLRSAAAAPPQASAPKKRSLLATIKKYGPRAGLVLVLPVLAVLILALARRRRRRRTVMLPGVAADAGTDEFPQVMAAYSAGSPGEPMADQSGPAEAGATRRLPARTLASRPVVVEASRPDRTSGPLEPVPWQGAVHPPAAPGGPPWGPAPKPEGDPPPPRDP